MAAFQSANLRVEQRPEGVAFLRLDVADRPVNVFTHQVMADLDSALDQIATDPGVRVLALRSDKPTGFMAGADLHEFAAIRTPEEAQSVSAMGQKVFEKLATIRMPTVALIHGPCLGGGLEFALACDYRLVLDHPKTQLGLPEVELGILPGWGGTQRLPRAVGLERALQVILAGRRLNAREALRWGLADQIGATEQELAAWLSFLLVRALKDGKQPRRKLPLRTWRQRLLESTGFGRFMVCRGAERLLRQRVPDDMPAPWEALKAVCQGVDHGMDAGLAYEREGIGRLATSSACRNLIHLFLQREEARKLPVNLADSPLPKIRRVGIVGAGTMGAGIAQLALLRGAEITIQEVNESALQTGIARLSDLLDKAVKNRILTAPAAVEMLASVQRTTTWEGFAQVDLVIEAAIEEPTLKRQLFQELERRTRANAILATNTSSLLVAQLQEGMNYPDRVGGLHFFNPVHKMPLVEVVRAAATSERTVALLSQWAVALGKTPVLVRDSPGFIVNRVLMPYLTEAVLLASQGMPITLIDRSMRRFGMPMGPIELLDQVGLDVAAHIARALAPVFSGRLQADAAVQAIPEVFERMRERGWLGQKSGRGFYHHQGKSRKVNAAALAHLPRGQAFDRDDLLRGLPKLQMREARERMVLPMVNEAAACLGEGIAANAATIDLAMVLGTGWAPHRGGPLRYAEERGLSKVVQTLEEMTQRLGARFTPCEALRQQAGEGARP